jgi:hypothetical protein
MLCFCNTTSSSNLQSNMKLGVEFVRHKSYACMCRESGSLAAWRSCAAEAADRPSRKASLAQDCPRLSTSKSPIRALRGSSVSARLMGLGGIMYRVTTSTRSFRLRSDNPIRDRTMEWRQQPHARSICLYEALLSRFTCRGFMETHLKLKALGAYQKRLRTMHEPLGGGCIFLSHEPAGFREVARPQSPSLGYARK